MAKVSMQKTGGLAVFRKIGSMTVE